MSDSERELDPTYFWPDVEEMWYAPEPDLREPWVAPRPDGAYLGLPRDWSAERRARCRDTDTGPAPAAVEEQESLL